MAEEDLTASHWDDIYTPSPFASQIPNILQSEEFAPPTFDDDDDDDEDPEHHEHHEEHHDNNQFYSNNYQQPKTPNDSPKSNVEDPLRSGFGDYNEPLNNFHPSISNESPRTDNASTEATKSINTEVSRARRDNLLSTLTKDIDENLGGNHLTASTLALIPQTDSIAEQVHKGENTLFQGLDDDDNKFKDFDINSAPLAGSSGNNTLKNSGSNSAPIKIYKAPRIRRNKLIDKSSINKDHSEVKQGKQSDSSNPLGPLGDSIKNNLTIDDDIDASSKKNKVDESISKLVESVDAPLYDISNKKGEKISPNFKKLTHNPEISSQVGEYFNERHEQQKREIEETLKEELQNQSIEKFEINVGDPTKVGDITSAHIVYTVRTVSSLMPDGEVVITRRYKDFRWLYHQLQSNNPGYIIPPPPIKQAVGRFNEQFIESRRNALEKMLQKISTNAVLQKDPDFLMFLKSTNFVNESKEREKITGSGASNANDDYEVTNVANSSTGGFMSALGGAFSFSVKVNDQDPFFIDQKAYIEDLDMHLRGFQRNFEIIIQQRNELSVVTEEFANAIQCLANIETNKSTNDLLNQFAFTHHRIKELFERQSMQDLITLGATLDEYIRILGSIRAIFSQRQKSLITFTNSDYELNKKKSSLEKLIRNHRSQVDKIDLLKKEIDSYEIKNNKLKENFDKISNTIKKQLSIFEIEKIKDFSNSIEIFLESLIESQKEAIELWETFYERQKLDEVDNIDFNEQE